MDISTFLIDQFAIFGLAFTNAMFDFHIINSGGRIRHTLEAIIRFILILLISCCNMWVLLVGLSVFWISFEIFLNSFRGKHWMYVGYTAFTDRMLRKMFKNPELALLLIKVTVLVISLIFTIKFVL